MTDMIIGFTTRDIVLLGLHPSTLPRHHRTHPDSSHLTPFCSHTLTPLPLSSPRLGVAVDLSDDHRQSSTAAS